MEVSRRRGKEAEGRKKGSEEGRGRGGPSQIMNN